MKRDLMQQAYGAIAHDLRKTVLTMLAWLGLATVILLLRTRRFRTSHQIFLKVSATALEYFPTYFTGKRPVQSWSAIRFTIPTLNCSAMWFAARPHLSTSFYEAAVQNGSLRSLSR